MNPSSEDSVLIYDNCGTRIRVPRSALEKLELPPPEQASPPTASQDDWTSELIIDDSDGKRVRTLMPPKEQNSTSTKTSPE